MSKGSFALTVLAQVLLAVLAGCGVQETPAEPTSTEIPAPTTSTSGPAPTTSPAGEPTPGVDPDPSVREIHLIYDDDGSRDGTVALLYLLSEPTVDMMAVSISYGEAHPDTYVQHIGRLLDAVGHADIPLGAGQDGPVGNGLPFPDWLRQLSDDFWNYQLPNAGKTYPVRSAPELMVDTINQASDPVTIFMSGTFTSLAQALRIDPGIEEKIDAVYIMGGAVFVPGNITNLIPDSTNEVSEWNLISDPVAAAEVFATGLEMYLVPLDSTNRVVFHREDIQPWHAGDEKARFSAELYDIMFDEYGWTEAEIFDLGAAVIMIEPDACEFVPLHLDVITDDGDTLGQTVANPDAEPNINVCLDPDADLIMQVLNDVFSGAPGSSDAPEVPPIDPVAGSWSGIVVNNGFPMELSITVAEPCRLGDRCGRFEIETIACSGVLAWVGMDGERYEFEASELTETCERGSDYLSPRADGTVEYLWKGDSGEASGILERQP